MATQAESPASTPSAQIVGNAFVEQYYLILHQSPELVYRFYQDSSVLSRPDSNGVMTSFTTMPGINEKIVSLNYKDYVAEIKTADAQLSLGGGVIVLVTGYMTGKDNVRKKFAQSFFLAPQEKGFFVLNDVFRYVEDEESAVPASDPVNVAVEHVEEAPQASEPEQPPPAPVHNGPVPESSYEEDLTNEAEVCDPSDNEDGSVTEEEVIDPPSQLNQSKAVTVTSELSASQDDGPKRSYASILKAIKANISPAPVKAPASNFKVKPPTRNQEVTVKPALVSEPSASTSETGPEKSDVPEEAEGHSIYVRNLPQNATSAQLEEVFAKFGPIKQGGVQVRSNKQGFCFGFVEFESASSMKSAIEASPILIGSRKAVIEEKRTTTRVSAAATANSGRGRYPSSRGGFRSESFRGRGNFGGGRGYGRSDFRNQGEFSGKPRGGAGRGAEGYQRVDQNGTGNPGRQGGQK
ncbi:ras GTPase-activating protein-binding protein 1-like [Chenopodium quinoa]|uniref:ras GTPase-activating protein-binding protein 1-like n=1 Tax=Chenopodium quinoa TaxID=63459 RepID=UPI000B77853C|nr:ras GTPase-activating protein-binding protein 1-like [Chenopodium quinoa]